MQKRTNQKRRPQTVNLAQDSKPESQVEPKEGVRKVTRRVVKKKKVSRPPGDNFSLKEPIKQKKKWPKVVAVVCVLLLVGFGILAAVSVSPAQEAYTAAFSAKNNLENVQTAIAEQDFEKARENVTAAKTDFEVAEENLNKLGWVKVVPYARTQFIAADHMVKGGFQLMGALETSFDVASSILEPLQSEGDSAAFRDFDSEKKGEILQQLKQSTPELERAYSQLELAEMEFEKIPEKGLISQIADASSLIDEQLPEGKKLFEEVIVAAKLLPSLAGYPGEQTYMLLFQNNTELRPSGGFLGSYGELVVKNAEIVQFTTHDVYGLDSASDIEETPPWQIQKLAAPFNKSWYMRDSNWSPDFQESSKNVDYFYQIEGGKRDFDGVIGITPDFIGFLLEITGPTEIPGQPYTFTSENFTETLQFHVEKNFVSKGIDERQRKDIISDLAGVLIGKILALPQDQWPRIYDIAQRSLMEKHLVMYLENEEAQEFLEQKNWAGRVQETEGDYVLVVDANMASLKTDEFIERSFIYSLDATQEKPKATLTATYKNNAPGFTWRTTRYRNWNRIYTPIGSEFGGVQGNEEGDEFYIDPANPFEVTEDLGKQSFGTFISIEPNDTETLQYSYTVPRSVVEGDVYTLYFQKQIGTIKPKAQIKLKFDREVQAIHPPELGEIVNNNEVEFNAELQTDREFKVKLK